MQRPQKPNPIQNINSETAKIEFLHLIFEYIKITLEDNILTTAEKENINYLKID